MSTEKLVTLFNHTAAVNLHRYKYGDVGNLDQFEYFTGILDICVTCEIQFT